MNPYHNPDCFLFSSGIHCIWANSAASKVASVQEVLIVLCVATLLSSRFYVYSQTYVYKYILQHAYIEVLSDYNWLECYTSLHEGLTEGSKHNFFIDQLNATIFTNHMILGYYYRNMKKDKTIVESCIKEYFCAFIVVVLICL